MHSQEVRDSFKWGWNEGELVELIWHVRQRPLGGLIGSLLNGARTKVWPKLKWIEAVKKDMIIASLVEENTLLKELNEEKNYYSRAWKFGIQHCYGTI